MKGYHWRSWSMRSLDSTPSLMKDISRIKPELTQWQRAKEHDEYESISPLILALHCHTTFAVEWKLAEWPYCSVVFNSDSFQLEKQWIVLSYSRKFNIHISTVVQNKYEQTFSPSGLAQGIPYDIMVYCMLSIIRNFAFLFSFLCFSSWEILHFCFLFSLPCTWL